MTELDGCRLDRGWVDATRPLDEPRRILRAVRRLVGVGQVVDVLVRHVRARRDVGRAIPSLVASGPPAVLRGRGSDLGGEELDQAIVERVNRLVLRPLPEPHIRARRVRLRDREFADFEVENPREAAERVGVRPGVRQRQGEVLDVDLEEGESGSTDRPRREQEDARRRVHALAGVLPEDQAPGVGVERLVAVEADQAAQVAPDEVVRLGAIRRARAIDDVVDEVDRPGAEDQGRAVERAVLIAIGPGSLDKLIEASPGPLAARQRVPHVALEVGVPLDGVQVHVVLDRHAQEVVLERVPLGIGEPNVDIAAVLTTEVARG